LLLTLVALSVAFRPGICATTLVIAGVSRTWKSWAETVDWALELMSNRPPAFDALVDVRPIVLSVERVVS
jgi:hypothetical protein